MVSPSAQIGCRESESRLRVNTAGCFAVFSIESGREVTPRGRKARAILAYLIATSGTKVPRERVAELLWGDRGEAQARASLRQCLLEVRQALSGLQDLISADREHLWIEADRLVENPGDGKGEAGEAFDDLDHITPEFDDWLVGERSRRASAHMAELRGEVEQLLDAGRGAEALPVLKRMARIDPYDEDVLRLALQAEFQSGRPAAIEQRFQAMATLLHDELGVELSSETRALRDRLLTPPANGDAPIPGPGRQAGAFTFAAAAPAVSGQPVSVARSPFTRSRVAMALAAIALGGGALSLLPAKGAGEPYRIAVLPFSAVGLADPALADGLSEELLSQFARNPSLRVTGRTSSWQYRNRAADLRKVGRELGVDYLVEGTVRRQGPGLRVTVALIKADDASALWSRSFSGSQQQAQPIQAAIGQGVIEALGLGAQAPLAKSTQGEAYLLYIRAKGLMRQRTGRSLGSARELLIEAVRLDPGFATAWAQLGGAARLMGQREFSLDESRPDGPRMTTQAAIRRALALDPKLAEGHAMMTLVLGFDSDEGRAHLRKALELEPRNPQTLYWWGMTLAMAGDHPRAAQATREAAAIDPLWQRPVGYAARTSLWAGDRESANRYLAVIRAGNPTGAVEVETTLAVAEGDFSRVIGRALGDRKLDYWSGALDDGYLALISLGFVSEGLLVRRLDEALQAVARRRAPDRATLLQAARGEAPLGDEVTFNFNVLWELGRVGRFADIAALYDARQVPMRDLDRRTQVNRHNRVILGGRVALALAMVGRKREAVHLLTLADEAGKTHLANGQVPPSLLVDIAANDAVLGRRDLAIAELQAAVAKGWRANEGINGEIGEDPMFATLRGDPRFERLRRQLAAWRTRERRETAALGVF